ncbi:MAG: 4Fe-4S dicluster domain-containing protein [Chloroflexi bacterium]|nr:4Fe-4S dicluster domain-containing protein [Chloroflexota bacterium]
MNVQYRIAHARARLYQELADAFEAPLPDWLRKPGSDNPLTEALVTAARELESPACLRALNQLANAPAQDLTQLRAHHARLLVGPGLPLVSPYESWHKDAQMSGSTSQEVAQWYEAYGAEPPAGELPDHMCIELAFLAYLYRQEAFALENEQAEDAEIWRKQAQRFLRKHPARWIPQVGETLAKQAGVVFGPLGELLAAFLREEAGLSRRTGSTVKKHKGFPVLAQPEACGLCSFCVQVCTTRALYISESNTETNLMLSPARCTGCGACTKTCPDDLLMLDARQPDGVVALRTSPRAICPSCGNVHVSEAEIEAVVARLEATGSLRQSLMYCVDCKARQGAGSRK